MWLTIRLLILTLTMPPPPLDATPYAGYKYRIMARILARRS